MKDISDRQDIELLVRSFYGQAREDELIGHFFNEVIDIDWESHFPRMFDFWETILLDVGKYRGSVMDKHFAIDRASKMNPEHFERWLDIWNQTVEQHFKGEKADMAKERARIIALSMSYKMTSGD